MKNLKMYIFCSSTCKDYELILVAIFTPKQQNRSFPNKYQKDLSTCTRLAALLR